MKRKYPPAPEVGPFFEDEETIISEVCLRIFDRVMEAVRCEVEAGNKDIDFRGLYSDILQDELRPYAFALAYQLYSRDPVILRERQERAAADRMASGERSAAHPRLRGLLREARPAARTARVRGSLESGQRDRRGDAARGSGNGSRPHPS